MSTKERKRLVALPGEQWAIRGDTIQEHLFQMAGFTGLGMFSRMANSLKSNHDHARFLCWLHFTLVGQKDPEPGWHTARPEFYIRPSFPRYGQPRAWHSLMGEFKPLVGEFESLPCPDTENIYYFQVRKRRLHALLLEGQRGLLDRGQNIGLYWGTLSHLQESDLATVGLDNEDF